MDDFLRRRALRAALEWQWVPYDASLVSDGSITLAISGGLARVIRADPPGGRSTAAWIAAAVTLATGAGASRLLWAVPDRGAPADLGGALLARGSRITEDLEIMVSDPRAYAAANVPVPPGVRRVDTPHLLLRSYEVESAVLGSAPRSAAFRRQATAALAAQVAAGSGRTAYRYVALAGGGVAATAGLTMAADVARLWGAAVLPPHRGRGLYRALLTVRLRQAVDRDATLALTFARQTSAPLLRRVGFQECGRLRRHLLPW